MAAVKRQPTSRLEKLIVGLSTLAQFQPAAHMEIEGDCFFVGDTTDPFVTEGMNTYLSGLGFETNENKKMYSFRIQNK